MTPPNRRTRLAIHFLTALLSAASISCSTAAPTDAQWREDLAYLADRIVMQHPNAFATMDRAEFEGAVANLDREIPDLKPHQIIVAMIRLVAMVGDGHTRLALPRGLSAKNAPPKDLRFRALPVSFYQFSDGLFIRRAARAHADLAGRKVLRIGKLSAEEAMEAVSPLVHSTRVIRKGNISLEEVLRAYDQDFPERNTSRFLAEGPRFLSTPEVLHALGLVDDMENVELELESGGGGREKVTLSPVSPGRHWGDVDARNSASGETPLYLRDGNKNFWFEYLEDERVVYVKYNAVQNMGLNTIAKFCAKLFRFVDELPDDQPIEKFVLDIRNNSGGNNNLNRPIVHGIVIREEINSPGKLFCIIGRQTFSAAMNCVNLLEQRTNVTFVGEPTGAAPNHFGDALAVRLPHSGLVAGVSTRYWQDSRPREFRPWIAPDVPARVSSADYLANRDPVLQAVLDYKK